MMVAPAHQQAHATIDRILSGLYHCTPHMTLQLPTSQGMSGHTTYTHNLTSNSTECEGALDCGKARAVCMRQDPVTHQIWECLLHVSTFATTRVALPTGVEPG
jgi:hypothetical protein